MGSLLGQILADIFMGNPEQAMIKHLIEGTTLHCRYTDNRFFVYNNQKDSMYLQDLFNRAHNDLDFTKEHEVKGRF